MQNKVKYLIEDNPNDIDISYFFKVLKNNIKLFIISFLGLFLLLVSYLYLSYSAEYSASFPITINNTGSQFVFNDLNNISKFSSNELKTKVRCTSDEIKSLRFIRVSGIINEEDKKEAIITISTNDTGNTKQIADKIITWASNNIEVKELIARKKSSVNSLINKIEQQLEEIQLIKKKVINSENEFESRVSFLEELAILEKKYQLTEELEQLNHVVKYSSQIYISNQAKNKSKKLPIFLFFIISIIFSSILTLIIGHKKK